MNGLAPRAAVRLERIASLARGAFVRTDSFLHPAKER
jgi:hypothetical protein